MAFKFPPPPTSNDPKDPSFRDWFYKLQQYLEIAGNILFNDLDFTGSNITSIETRNHNDLQNIQGGIVTERYHLTAAQVVSLEANNPTPVFFPEDGGGDDGFIVPGSQGPQGATGATGPAGPSGSTYTIQGFDGEDGEEGQPGQTGAQGIQGIQGPAGVSAISSTIIMLDGVDGEDGMMGPPGLTGTGGGGGPTDMSNIYAFAAAHG